LTGRSNRQANMDKLIIVSLIIFLIWDVSNIAAVNAQEGFDTKIEQSPHDFSHASWLQQSRICNVCHTVHNEAAANLKYADGLTWKREVYSVSYNMYYSYWGATFVDSRFIISGTTITGKQSHLPDGLSKICLSCHDGIIAPDVFRLHHFVSAEYNVATTTLRDPDLTKMGISGPISEVLDNGKIQCSSCHDVHGVESFANTKLLRTEKSKLCTTCHKVNIVR
jgi:predicted CXXCH cytochrome family protein